MKEENSDWQPVFTELAKAELEKLKVSWQELSKVMTLKTQQTITPEEFFRLVKAHALKTGQALQFAYTHSQEYAAKVRTFDPANNRSDEVSNLREENETIRKNFFYLQQHAVARNLYERTLNDLKSIQFLANVACSGTFYYSARCDELEEEVKALKAKLLQLDSKIDFSTLLPGNAVATPEDITYIERLAGREPEVLPPYVEVPNPQAASLSPASIPPVAFFQPAPPPLPRVWPTLVLQENFDKYYSDAIQRWKRFIGQNLSLKETCMAMFDHSQAKENLNSRIIINQISLCTTSDPLDLCLLMDKEFRENTFIEKDIGVKNQVDFCRQMLFRQFGPSSKPNSLSHSK